MRLPGMQILWVKGSFEIGGMTMCSPMLTVQAAPTSASLVQGACCDIWPLVHEKYEAECNPLHMDWGLVDNTKGNPQAEMPWMVEG